MGPDASARLVTQIVVMSRKIGYAKNSDDYPNFIMQNIPVPDFFDNPSLCKPALKILIDSIKDLEKLNPRYFAIACNTVHSILPKLETVTKVPFLNVPILVAEKAKKLGYKKVGLLATPLTYETQIYSNAFNKFDIEIFEPKQINRNKLGNVVHTMLKGDFVKARVELLKIANELSNEKVDAIILGCTELPLIFPKRYKLPQISSLDCLAENIVKLYYV